MRYSTLLTTFILSVSAIAQTEVTLGQPYKDQTILLIRNSASKLEKLEQIPNYQNVTEVRLANFNDETTMLDSVLGYLSAIKGIKIIRFEKCDLLYLSKNLNEFKNLNEVHITDKSDFFENSFFPLLKNVPLKRLFIETTDPEIITDSIALLSQLEKIEISSGKTKGKLARQSLFQVKSGNKTQKINIDQYGDFPSSKSFGLRDDLATNPTETQSHFNYSRNGFDFIQQPVIDIDIHDTLYTFPSSEKKSYTYYSGSTLSFDKDAFEYNNGTPYKGGVKVFYREFRNPVEIMLSGIPMTNNVNGKKEFFKSGGMFQINAFDEKGQELRTKSDTSVKINFALTDTSSNFQFFSLNQNGSWSTTSVNITPTASKTKGTKPTRAISEYFAHLLDKSKEKPDTTNFYRRFDDMNYCYTFRKDNMTKNGDNYFHSYVVSGVLKKNYKYNRTKGFFRVKYYKQTKDKEVVFKIIPAKKDLDIPEHISALLNREFLYTGNLNKQEFKNTFNRKILAWDIRNNGFGNEVDLVIKTDKAFLNISGKLINLKDDRTYTYSKIAGKVLNINMQRNLKKEGKRFNKRERLTIKNENSLSKRKAKDRQMDAYEYCITFQNNEEKKLSFKEWKKYAGKFSQFVDWDDFQDNEVGNALVKSGMGIKNIDCYLHSGAMEDILVEYKNTDLDSIGFGYNSVLYRNINTSFPLVKSLGKSTLSGYYFKKNDNFIIRFSDDGYMQVSKPQETLIAKKGDKIVLNYTNQYFIKGMNSEDITRLILK